MTWKKEVLEARRQRGERAVGDKQERPDQAVVPQSAKVVVSPSQAYRDGAGLMDAPTKYVTVRYADDNGPKTSAERVLSMFKKSEAAAQDAKPETLPTNPGKLSNAAKREAVMAALKGNEAKTSRELAELCGVSHTYISKLRAELAGNVSKPKTKAEAEKPKASVNVSKSAKASAKKMYSDLLGRAWGENKDILDKPPDRMPPNEAKMMFLHLGCYLGNEYPQWLLEAFELLRPDASYVEADIADKRRTKKKAAK